jgi:hypothetical protein
MKVALVPAQPLTGKKAAHTVKTQEETFNNHIKNFYKDAKES